MFTISFEINKFSVASGGYLLEVVKVYIGAPVWSEVESKYGAQAICGAQRRLEEPGQHTSGSESKGTVYSGGQIEECQLFSWSKLIKLSIGIGHNFFNYSRGIEPGDIVLVADGAVG